eukprot:5543792-Prymnesium_polylepis.1
MRMWGIPRPPLTNPVCSGGRALCSAARRVAITITNSYLPARACALGPPLQPNVGLWRGQQLAPAGPPRLTPRSSALRCDFPLAYIAICGPPSAAFGLRA